MSNNKTHSIYETKKCVVLSSWVKLKMHCINSQLYDRLHIYRILLGVDLGDGGGGEKESKLLTAYH